MTRHASWPSHNLPVANAAYPTLSPAPGTPLNVWYHVLSATYRSHRTPKEVSAQHLRWWAP
jgi:hypothetical protein